MKHPSPQWTWLNDSLLPDEEAALHVSDLAFLRGYGVFDFFRVINKHPLFLAEHLQRFNSSARQLHLTIPCAQAELESRIYQLIEKGNFSEGGIRLTLTGGYSGDGYTPSDPNLVISTHAISSPGPELRSNGISLMTYAYQRQLPEVKSIDYLFPIWLQPLLKENKTDDILYHHEGIVSECPRMNFFIVTADDCIKTPATGILPGITRSRVLKLASEKFSVQASELHLEEILLCKEAFVTSTTKGVLPVNRVNDHSIKPGPVAAILHEMLEKQLDEEGRLHSGTTI